MGWSVGGCGGRSGEGGGKGGEGEGDFGGRRWKRWLGGGWSGRGSRGGGAGGELVGMGRDGKGREGGRHTSWGKMGGRESIIVIGKGSVLVVVVMMWVNVLWEVWGLKRSWFCMLRREGPLWVGVG